MNMEFRDGRKPRIVYFDIELDDSGLNPYEFRLYCRIARRCGGSLDGKCFESQSDMARNTGMSLISVKRYLKTLENKRFIHRVPGKTDQTPTIITLLDKSAWSTGICEIPELVSESAGTGICEIPELVSESARTGISKSYKEEHEVNTESKTGEESKTEAKPAAGSAPCQAPPAEEIREETQKSGTPAIEQTNFAHNCAILDFHPPSLPNPFTEERKQSQQSATAGANALKSDPEPVDSLSAPFENFSSDQTAASALAPAIAELTGLVYPMTAGKDRDLNAAATCAARLGASVKDLNAFALSVNVVRLRFFAEDFSAWFAAEKRRRNAGRIGSGSSGLVGSPVSQASQATEPEALPDEIIRQLIENRERHEAEHLARLSGE
jgi:DNA-binding MarR family transcriptional regulator